MAEMTRENDLVLRQGEYSLILDRTKGQIAVACGPFKISLSSSDEIVALDEETDRFVVANRDNAIKPFITVKENWYVELTNPTKDGSHPRTGTTNNAQELQLGRRVIVRGPASFALYPMQKARVIPGHVLRSNQYLLAGVYDTSMLEDKYEVGQILVIRGNTTPFYIPPTGIEVIQDDDGNYVRDAVTLERLEYSILKNEAGEKRYVYGPAVVFPEANEDFINNPETGEPKFKAIELSDISGVYVKVIADYTDGDIKHEAGEELFITGKDTMIYYPRPEHAIISYDGKVIHHAIIIPAGEGRYIVNRTTGDVKMVKGPRMYLPDPRKEVIVHRKLDEKQCRLWYPGNNEVLKFNDILPTTTVDSIGYSNSLTSSNACYTIGMSQSSARGCITSAVDNLSNGFLGQDNVVTANDGFSRGNTYSKPRTITIDNKYDGVVSINVWTGYAINVVSKDGKRKTIVGPQTYLMEYDETLETVKGKDGDTVYLRVDNDRIDDVIRAQTKDFVDVDIAVTYCVNFADNYQEKWFSIKDYIGYLTDRERSDIKTIVKGYGLEEFYTNGSNIIKNAISLTVQSTGKKNSDDATTAGKCFSNGMYIDSIEVLNIKIANNNVREMLDSHQAAIVKKSLELSAATKEMSVTTELEKLRAQKLNLEYARAMHEIDVKNKTEMESLTRASQVARAKEEDVKASKEAEKNLQTVIDAIKKAELAREKLDNDQTLAWQKEQAKLEADRQKAYTDSVKKVVDSIGPELVAAINSSSQSEMVKEIVKSLSPYALASGDESVADVVDKLFRGSGLNGFVDLQINNKDE